MSIAIVIPERWEPAKLVHWSTTIARAKDDDLLIIRARRLGGRHDRKHRKTPLNVAADHSPLAAALREYAQEFTVVDLDVQKDFKLPKKRARDADNPERFICVKRFTYAQLIEGVLKQIRALRVRQLIIPRPPGVRIAEYEFAAERQLFLEVPCETLQLRPGKRDSDDCSSILVATSGSKYAVPALNLGAAFASSNESKLTALYVDEKQTSAPRKKTDKRNVDKVEKSVRKSLKAQAEQVAQDTVVDEDVPKAVRSYATAKGHDLVIVGAGGHLSEERRRPTSVSEKLMTEMDEPTVVVVRRAMSLAGRALKTIEDRKKSIIPQLDRSGRIELVGRLKSSGNWDFDFALLICLATLLAALGLALDSAPVVIGAMLVAPLMSPMLGLGLSVVQGNRHMGHACISTVGRGFLVALATGCAVGILRILFTSGLTQQMANRGEPGVVDLVVAFVSGVVAAYAFGRPHLLSVIPGIAIATSLVPPVATAGLSLTTLELNVALGATLLFLSNFIAIVLGCASSLWIVGMRGPREICPFTAWARRWMFGFFAVAVCLAAFFTAKREYSQAHAASVAASDTSTEPSALSDGEQPNSQPDEPAAPRLPKAASSVAAQQQHKAQAADADPAAQNSGEEIHMVLKPAVSDSGEAIGTEITVTLPPPPANLTEDEAKATTEDPLRGRPLLKRLRNLSLRMRRAKKEQTRQQQTQE